MRCVPLVFAVVAVFSIGAYCQSLNYGQSCNLKDPSYQYLSDAPKLKYDDGYEVFIQAPVYAEVNQNIVNILKLAYPVNETFFIRTFANPNGKGSMYIMGKHKMISLLWNKNISESMLVDYQYGSCDVQPMIYEPGFSYGYFHGNKQPIHIPFPDMLVDLTGFKVKKLPTTTNDRPYRGFHNVQRYEGCINAHDVLVRVLKELQAITIPQAILDMIPSELPVRATWTWADPDWEMEDGTAAQTGPVPLGIELSGGVSIVAPRPLNMYLDLAINATMTMANYHSHYPAHDVYHDLLQPPAGIHCKRNSSWGGWWPDFPTFPPKFHIKTESLIYGDHSFAYNSEDFYDFDAQLFRFDVSLNRPDRSGPVVINLYHDYKNKKVYEINKSERTCKQRDLEDNPTSGKFDTNPINHLAMRPYDIVTLGDISPSYIGVKPCRGMACHYWVGRKDLTTVVDGEPTYGIFGVWATTGKWSQNFSTADPLMSHFIVQIDVQIFSKKTNQKVGREHLQIFDYYQITGANDLFFAAPTAAYCGDDDNVKSPELPQRYQYRGEYSEQASNTSTPIFLNYDVDWNVIRFDWTPTQFDQNGNGAVQFRQAYVYDRVSSTNYQINQVTGECIVIPYSPEYAGDDIEALAILWPPRLHENINERRLKYLGAQPCRRMTCDTFEYEDKRADHAWIYEYQFTTENFQEISYENPSVINKKVLARIARFRFEDEKLDTDRLRSVDIFGYMNHRSVYWEYEVVAPCFANVASQWVRLYFTADNPDALNYIQNDYFRIEMMDQLRQNATVSPLRISDLRVSATDDGRVVAEFKLRDRHPQENFKGPSLNDALQSLSDSVTSGTYTVRIRIHGPDGSETDRYYLTAEPNFEQCDVPCSSAQYAIPVVELDVGALAGTIIGSVLAGVLVIGGILTVVVSRKHQVPMQSLYIGSVPGTGVSHDLPPVSMSSGIAVSNDKGDE